MAETEDERRRRTGEITDATEESIRLNGENTEQLRKNLRELDKILNKQKDINAKIKVSNDYFQDYKSISSDIFKNEVEKEKIINRIKEISIDNASIVQQVADKQQALFSALEKEKNETANLKEKREKLRDLIAEGASLQDAAVSRLQAEIQLQNSLTDAAIAQVSAVRDTITDQELELLALERMNVEHEATLNTLKRQDELQREINKKMGVAGGLVKGISSLLSKAGLDKYLNMDLVLAKMRKAAEKGGPMSALLTGAKMIGSALAQSLSDPLIQLAILYKAFKSLVSLGLDYQKKIFEASKNLGLNVKESERLVNSFNKIAIQNTRTALTSEQILKTYQELSDRLGVMTVQDEEFLATSSAIMRNLGLNAEHMESIQMFAVRNNKTVKETLASVVGTAKVQGARLKISMTEKQIVDGISKVSATVFNNFKGNVVELSKAVVQATKFGTTLDQINQAGMSMLDFESSISKEFEAQLLTGKNIDLSRARQLALTGSTAELMEEITNQLGSQDEWNGMNVLKQQSLAESLGMNKEAIDEMFRKQQLVSVLGENASKSAQEQYQFLKDQNKSHADIVKLMGEEAVNSAIQASAQDRLKASIDNMALAFGAIADAFLPITSVLTGISSLMNKITGSSKTLAVILSGILGYYIGIRVAQGYIYASKQKELILDAAKKAGEIMSMKRASFTAVAKAMGFGGPAGLIFAGIVGAALAGYAASLGVEGVGSSVASANPPSPTNTDKSSISPMNPAAANATTYRTEKERSSKLTVNNYVKVDPITGKVMIETISQDPSVSSERRSGQFSTN